MKWPLMFVALGLAPVLVSTPLQSAPSPSADIDADAMQALDRMGEALRRRAQVDVHADLTVEDVTMSGQKLQYGGSVDIVARRPNQLRMDMRIVNGTRQLFYDGAKLTFYSANHGTYATAAAPATIRETLVAAREQFGLEIPLADLFMWGDDPTLAQRVRGAFRVGSEAVGEHMCDHYAVRQNQVDWQIWMRQGSDPLPCKLVITDRTDPAMPQVTAVYDWRAASAPSPSTFTFVPPAGAQPIIFGKVQSTTSKSGN